ncbi:MAG: hypothetical protein ACLT76_01930 [Clostridium fessum]
MLYVCTDGVYKPCWSMFRQRGTRSLRRSRLLGSTIPNLSELGLPEAVNQFSSWNKGIILVTGETGKRQVNDAGGNLINQSRRSI